VERKSKVNQHDVVIVCAAEEEVLSLEVSVAYFLEVKIFNGLYHLQEDVPSFVLTETSKLVDSVEKLTALAQAK
jgi:hypothetical protein